MRRPSPGHRGVASAVLDLAVAETGSRKGNVVTPEAVELEYWSLPARERGAFVLRKINGYHADLPPDLSPGKRAQMTIAFADRLVKVIDFDNGGPMARLARQVIAKASGFPAAKRV